MLNWKVLCLLPEKEKIFLILVLITQFNLGTCDSDCYRCSAEYCCYEAVVCYDVVVCCDGDGFSVYAFGGGD